jgi:hypothetical protein
MAKSPRKRYNAFDDFPTETAPDQPPAAPVTPLTARVDSVPVAQVERIERLKPSQMLPDRFQPRRLLPAALREAFFSGKMDCYQAAAEWLAMARSDAGYQDEIDRLRAMGSSFEEHGQIKPITGSWVPATDGRYIFLIETGERRFWAACLQAVTQRRGEEPLLRVEAVSHPTRQRQVLENRHAEPPSAVGQACEVAALILAELGVEPDSNLKDEFDYFRQVRNMRMPEGLWSKVIPVMQVTRERMSQLLKILELPTPLLEMADRYRLPERVLREVLMLPREQWQATLRSAAQNNLTSDEVAAKRPEIEKRRPRSTAHPEPGRVAANALRRFAFELGELDEFSQSQALDEIANTLVVTSQAEGVLNLLDELSRRVNARLSRM